MDNNLYTVTINKEGVYQVVTDADAELKVRVQTGGGLEVENALPGTPLTLTVTPGLGYTIDTVQVNQNDGNGLQPLNGGTLPAGALVTNTTTEFKYTFTMPAKHLIFKAAPASIPSVNKVAYVSQDGWNSAGYDSAARTADSWGTASTDLQKVINSWTGPTSSGGNFDEIWVHGTVTPKTDAKGTGAYSGYDLYTGTDSKSKAFLILPGLKIYGGFTGNEGAGFGSGQFPGPISAAAGNDKRDRTISATADWRARTVLSGKLDNLNNTYHAVVLAYIPDDGETILDGFTVSGTMGPLSPHVTKVYQVGATATYIQDQSGAGLYLLNASPVIRNLRVQENTSTNQEAGGISGGGGGGMYVLAINGGTSSPRISDTLFSRNLVMGTGSGGGVHLKAQDPGSTCSPRLDNITIEMNQTSGNGGGIYLEAFNSGTCAPVITNTEITRNSAAYGGGIYNGPYSTATFTDVVVSKNATGFDGGGIYTDPTATPVCTNVTVAANRAVNGGGVLNYGYYTTMTNVTISGNLASGYGGAIYNNCGGAVLTNVLLEGNYSYKGGGAIYTAIDTGDPSTSAVLIITNGIIRGNIARASKGGGIHAAYGFDSGGSADLITYLALTNVLIAGNMAGTYGGGIYTDNTLPYGTATPGKGVQIIMTNVTLADNGAYSMGAGIYIPQATGGPPVNLVAVTANNCVIWGNIVPWSGDPLILTNLVNLTAGRLTFASSLVQDSPGPYSLYAQYTDGGSNQNPASFTGTWGPFAGADNYTLPAGSGLANEGSNAPYPANADALLNNTGGINNGALAGDAGRYARFKGLIEDAVFSSVTNNIGKDASAGQGDLRYKVTGDATNFYSVQIVPEPKVASANPRVKNGVIDIGAYEKQ
jgi:predicted outer membrane repeat protein